MVASPQTPEIHRPEKGVGKEDVTGVMQEEV